MDEGPRRGGLVTSHKWMEQSVPPVARSTDLGCWEVFGRKVVAVARDCVSV